MGKLTKLDKELLQDFIDKHKPEEYMIDILRGMLEDGLRSEFERFTKAVGEPIEKKEEEPSKTKSKKKPKVQQGIEFSDSEDEKPKTVTKKKVKKVIEKPKEVVKQQGIVFSDSEDEKPKTVTKKKVKKVIEKPKKVVKQPEFVISDSEDEKPKKVVKPKKTKKERGIKEEIRPVINPMFDPNEPEEPELDVGKVIPKKVKLTDNIADYYLKVYTEIKHRLKKTERETYKDYYDKDEWDKLEKFINKNRRFVEVIKGAEGRKVRSANKSSKPALMKYYSMAIAEAEDKKKVNNEQLTKLKSYLIDGLFSKIQTVFDEINFKPTEQERKLRAVSKAFGKVGEYDENGEKVNVSKIFDLEVFLHKLRNGGYDFEVKSDLVGGLPKKMEVEMGTAIRKKLRDILQKED